MAKRRARKMKTAPKEKTKKVVRKHKFDPYVFPEPIVGMTEWNGGLVLATARGLYQMNAGTFVRLRLFNEGEDIVDAG